MNIPSVFGRIVYGLMRPFLGLFFSGKSRTRALVIHKSQVLLVRNWKGRQKWTLPGGGVKKKESSGEAIIRELKEELDLDIYRKDLKYIAETNHTEGSAKYPVIIYQLDLLDKPSFSIHRPEIIDAKWHQLNNLPSDIDGLTERTIKQQR